MKQNQTKNNYIYIIIIIIGLLLSATVALFVYKTTLNQKSVQFKIEAENMTSALDREINKNLSVLHAITGFYNSSNFVSRKEFKTFSESFVKDGRYDLQALEWIPRVKSDQRELFEKSACAEGCTGFQFTEKVDTGFITAKERDEYFPVYYLEPFEGNENAFGYDLGSSPTRLEALNHSMNSGEIVATKAIRLVQDEEHHLATLVFSPIYKGPATSITERRNNLVGFTLAVFKISDIIKNSLNQVLIPYEVTTSLYEMSASDESKQIYSIQPDPEEIIPLDTTQGLFHQFSTLSIAGVKWGFSLTARNPAKDDLYSKNEALLSFFIGLFFTIITALYFRKRELYTNEIENEIIERIIFEKELNAAKNTAEEATRSKTQFLANMSHEIRTPMNAIIGFSDLLLETDMQKKQKEHLEIINQSANNLLILLNDILDTSKLESQKIVLEEQFFVLPTLIQNIIATLGEKATRGKIELNLKYDDSLASNFIGDENRLRQILFNIIDNAIKFTPQNGNVFVTVSPVTENDMVLFTIIDNGIGMSEEEVDRIFTPFAQADASISRRYGGTGLGTTISKQLIELMDGEICIDSSVGKGSSFNFTVKLKEATASDTLIDKNDDKDNIQIRSLNILLVEDIFENSELATLRLTQMGHITTLAKNGKEAIDFWQNDNPFDIILMDIHMPIMDGLTATKHIRELEKESGHHIPILAMSASVMTNEKEAYKQAGIDGVVAKPIDFKNLVSELKRVLPKTNLSEPHSLDNSVETRVETATENDLPVINGVDVPLGLERWNDLDIYLKNLSSFAVSHDNDFDKITQAIQDTDFITAREQLHALSGVAGNLAMPKVFTAVELLSNMLNDGESTNFDQALQNLQSAMSEVLESIRKWEEEIAPVKSVQNSPTYSPEIVTPMLEQLKGTIARNRFDEALLNDLIMQITGIIEQPVIENLKQAINNFDFTNAHEILISIQNNLSVKDKGDTK